MAQEQSDVLVVFGATGDLAHKMIFPSLYAMVKRGALNTPIIGVAFNDWTRDQLIARAKDAVSKHVDTIDEAAFSKMAEKLSYVSGDYRSQSTFDKLKQALAGHQNPLYYLAIPPSLFETVADGLDQAGIAKNARLMVEKPFWARPCFGQEAERRAAQGVRGRCDLSHRPLPWQGSHSESSVFSLCQQLP